MYHRSVTPLADGLGCGRATRRRGHLRSPPAQTLPAAPRSARSQSWLALLAVGVNHESLGRVADVVEGIAGEQRERWLGRWGEHPQLLGPHNLEIVDDIAPDAVGHGEA